MAENCNMFLMPEPFYDKYTKAIYVCDEYNIHKYDQEGNWSIALENIKDNSVRFEWKNNEIQNYHRNIWDEI